MVEEDNGSAGKSEDQFTASAELQEALGDAEAETNDYADSLTNEASDFIDEVAERAENEEIAETARSYLRRKGETFLQGLRAELAALRSSSIELPSREFVDKHTPKQEWFTNETYIHSAAHQMRVIMLVKLISGMVGADLSETEEEALARAGSLHDTRRETDHDDPSHGDRAETFADTEEMKVGVDAETNRLSRLIMKFHLKDEDELAGEPALQENPRLRLLLNIFKDADAWDRYRDPKEHPEGPDPAYLHFKEVATRISHIAEAFANLTCAIAPEKGDWLSRQTAAVIDAGRALGILEEQGVAKPNG